MQLFQCGLDKKVNGIVGILDAYDNVRRGGFAPSLKASLVQVIKAQAKIASFSEVRILYHFLEPFRCFVQGQKGLQLHVYICFLLK